MSIWVFIWCQCVFGTIFESFFYTVPTISIVVSHQMTVAHLSFTTPDDQKCCFEFDQIKEHTQTLQVTMFVT